MLRLALAGLLLATTAVAEPMPIRFAPGTASATVDGAAERGGRAVHSFAARAGQQARLRVTAVEENAVFQVYLPGARQAADGVVAGATLPGAGETDDATEWSGPLPRDGTYLVVVGATRGGTTYRLSLAIR